MKNVFTLICCFLMLGLLEANATDTQYLHVKTVDGWRVLDLEKVDRLTFTAGSMVASDADDKTIDTFDRSNLSEMYIDESAGVESVVYDDADATFRYENGMVTMLTDGRFNVYAIDGTLLVQIYARQGENIDLSKVSEKFVILKSGRFTLKVSL